MHVHAVHVLYSIALDGNIIIILVNEHVHIHVLVLYIYSTRGPVVISGTVQWEVVILVVISDMHVRCVTYMYIYTVECEISEGGVFVPVHFLGHYITNLCILTCLV